MLEMNLEGYNYVLVQNKLKFKVLFTRFNLLRWADDHDKCRINFTYSHYGLNKKNWIDEESDWKLEF